MIITPAQHYSFSALVTGLAATALCFFVYFRALDRRLVKYFVWYVYVIAHWSFFVFACTSAGSHRTSYLLCQICHSVGVFIPIAFLHFVKEYIQSKSVFLKRLIRFGYAATALISLSIILKPAWFITDVTAKLTFRYFPDAGPLFVAWTLLFVCFVLVANIFLFVEVKRRQSTEKKQVIAFLIANLFGYTGGIGCFLPVYNLSFFPFPYGVWGVFFFTFVTAYAVLRYQLMDIKIAITRTSIFVFVYCIVLGMPALLVWQGRQFLEASLGSVWWLLPGGLFAALSFSGPFIYLLLQRKAEAVLLKEQKRYQQTLLQASRGMTLIKDLDHLLRLMVHILTKTIRITHARIFLWDSEGKQFICKAARGDHRKQGSNVISETASLIQHIKETKDPLVLEEVRAQGPASMKPSGELAQEMESLDAAVVVPSFVQDRLLGFVVLGDKKSKRLYTESDLDTLATLANQAALAIENCIFLTEFEHQQAHFFQTAKMADLGTMASGIGHQVNNRFNITKGGAELMLLSSIPRLERYLKDMNAEGIDKVLSDMKKALKTISDNGARGGEIVSRLLDFSRMTEGFKPVDAKEAIESCLRLWECKHDLTLIDFKLDIAADLPKLHGNLGEIEEVLFNLLDNAFDAFKMKEEAWSLGKLEKPAVASKGAVSLSAKETMLKDKRYVELTIADNGLGMDAEVKKQVFVPFFTTKATAIKGTGLGLYIIRKMVDAHQGQIFLESEYGKGTAFHVLIPVSEEKRDGKAPVR